MTEGVSVRRSLLGQVRGLGSAHAGTHHWTVERITALALVPLTLWFVVSLLGLLGADQPTVAAWVAHPWTMVLLIALLALTFHHLHLGLQVVYEDYIHTVWLMHACILATRAAALLAGLLGAVSVLRLGLAVHGAPA
jgi:succinate dehydrogenase / fumarate reductase, membrane anchor subunit